MNSFLAPVVQMINEGMWCTFYQCYYFVAFYFGISTQNTEFPQVHAMILPVICDSKAKSEVMNFISSNGYTGCGKCVHPGEHINNKHIYPFIEDSSHIANTLRTDMHTLECLQKLLQNPEEKCVEGVKNYSVLSALPNFSWLLTVW